MEWNAMEGNGMKMKWDEWNDMTWHEMNDMNEMNEGMKEWNEIMKWNEMKWND